MATLRPGPGRRVANTVNPRLAPTSANTRESVPIFYILIQAVINGTHHSQDFEGPGAYEGDDPDIRRAQRVEEARGGQFLAPHGEHLIDRICQKVGELTQKHAFLRTTTGPRTRTATLKLRNPDLTVAFELRPMSPELARKYYADGQLTFEGQVGTYNRESRRCMVASDALKERSGQPAFYLPPRLFPRGREPVVGEQIRFRVQLNVERSNPSGGANPFFNHLEVKSVEWKDEGRADRSRHSDGAAADRSSNGAGPSPAGDSRGRSESGRRPSPAGDRRERSDSRGRSESGRRSRGRHPRDDRAMRRRKRSRSRRR